MGKLHKELLGCAHEPHRATIYTRFTHVQEKP